MAYKEDDSEQVAFKDASGFYTTKKRSAIMQRIRGKNTKPELILRRALWHLGYRYRLNVKGLPGSPDVAIKKYRLAIFIDGEFWHGYQWEQRKQKIKSNREFWLPKIERNMQRDRRNTQKLEAAGWTVLRFWAREVETDLEFCMERILFHLGYYK